MELCVVVRNSQAGNKEGLVPPDASERLAMIRALVSSREEETV
jgi:hypothetical protein